MPPFMSPAANQGSDGLGAALMEDLKSEFGGSAASAESIDDMFEEVPAPEEPQPELMKEDKAEPTELSPLAQTAAVEDYIDERDDELKARELAAKSAAEAEELGDSLLALIDATETDRSASIDKATERSKDEEPEPAARKEDSPGKSGTRALGSLLGALSASDDELEEEDKDEKSGNAFAAAVASSASNPSLTEKSKKESSGSAFGQLLAAVKEEDDPPQEEAEPPSGGLPKKAIEEALDDLLPEEPGDNAQKIRGMKNPFAASGNDLLGGASGEGAQDDGGDGLTAAAARLAAAMSDSESGSDFNSSGARSGLPNPSTSTSDALSRLLEAASKAPSKASESGSMTEIDKMAARVNKPPAKVSRKLASFRSSEADTEASKLGEPQPFGGFGAGAGSAGGGGAFGGQPGGNFGGIPDSMRSSGVTGTGTTGTNSSYSQDAVNARIAELNRKLEQQSLGRDVELPPAPPPDPSVIGDSMNRRDVVNRIMEEAAMRHQYGADYQPPDPAPIGKPTNSGSDFSASELEKVNSNRLASMAEAEQRRKKSRGKAATMPRFPVVPVLAGIIVVGVGVFGFLNKETVIATVSGMMSGFGSSDKQEESDDNALINEVNDLISKGRLNDARKLLEQEEDAKGLPPALSDKLDNIYLSIAKYKKNNGATNEAIDTLKMIPTESAHYQEAQRLLKQFQQKVPKKPPSGKRKRRS